MRELTEHERRLLGERRERFESFLEEMFPVLGDFAESLGLVNPHTIAEDPDAFVPPIGQFMCDQVIEADDRSWIVTRLGYFFGEVLNRRLGGCWLLNEWPDTRYFLRYVVGQFGDGTRANAMVDPFEVAGAFVAQPPGRDLAKLIGEVEAGCRVA